MDQYFVRKIRYLTGVKRIVNAHPQLTLLEKASIYGYTINQFNDLNSYLRGHSYTKSAVYLGFYSRTLSRALRKIGRNFTGVVYRGAIMDHIDISIYSDAFQAGVPITHSYFTSTTQDPAQSFMGNVQFVINSKRGVDISKVSAHEKETEILFDKGTSFEITDINHDVIDDVYYIYMDEI
jgi:hypothetical protein